MGPWREINTVESLDSVVDKLTKATATAVDRHTPDLRPSPYAKQWFTSDLKSQKTELNRLRCKWQASCAEFGRDDLRTKEFFDEMHEMRRAWTRTIEKAKKSHWKQFLDEAGEGKLWKAATYMKPRDSWGCIPALNTGDREVTDNREKAQAFMDSFPAMASPEEEPLTYVPAEIPWQPISKLGSISH